MVVIQKIIANFPQRIGLVKLGNMTLKEWHDDPELRMNLRRILNTSPMREAIELLTQHNLPRYSVINNADPMVTSALQHARNSGYYDFRRALVKLTEDPPDPKKQLPEPWGNSSNL
jgi:hypothetical protein